MLSAILNILSKLLTLFVWWKADKRDPANQYEQAKSDNAKAVTSGDADSVNARLDSDLDRLRDKFNRDSL
jgi:glucose-6-phosphate dehydrogenase assembly protein OpcA